MSKFNWYQYIKTVLIEYLKTASVKAILARLLLTAGGFKAWLISFIIGYAFDKVAAPIIRAAVRQGKLIYDETQGKILVKKVKQAEEDEDEEDFWTHVGRS